MIDEAFCNIEAYYKNRVKNNSKILPIGAKLQFVLRWRLISEFICGRKKIQDNSIF